MSENIYINGILINNYQYFYPFEIVVRGSETTLKVCEDLNPITLRF